MKNTILNSRVDFHINFRPNNLEHSNIIRIFAPNTIAIMVKRSKLIGLGTIYDYKKIFVTMFPLLRCFSLFTGTERDRRTK